MGPQPFGRKAVGGLAIALTLALCGCETLQQAMFGGGYRYSQPASYTSQPTSREALLRRAAQLEQQIAAQRQYATQCARTARAYQSYGHVRKEDRAGFGAFMGLAQGQAAASAQRSQQLEMEYRRVMILLQQGE